MDSGTLSAMAQRLLADTVTDLNLGTPAPDRQIVSHGLRFAHDCEMVAVGVVEYGFDNADGGNLPGFARAPYVPTVTFQIMWLRCWPTIVGDQLPAADDITAAALGLAVDAANVGNGVTRRWSVGTLFSETPDPTHLLTVPSIVPVSPEGGLAGWRVTVGARL